MPTRGLLGKRYLKKAIVITSVMMMTFFYIFLSVPEVFAQSTTPVLNTGIDQVGTEIGLGKTDIRLIVANIIRAALGFLGIIAIILVMYAGFIWMTAGGNEENIGKAKKILINATIGLIIILSAYSIVLFVMKMLGMGPSQAGGPQYNVPSASHFAGSGALGGIIKDHYPERNQKNVPRNTKILITFRKPILASSTIADTNGNGIFGDCLQDETFSWKDPLVCDRLRSSDGKIAVAGNDGGSLSDDYINIVDLKTGKSIKAAVVLASTSTIKGVNGVYTLTIKPLTDLSLASGGYLGTATEKIQYKVRLGSEIRLEDNANNHPKAFNSSVGGNDYYDWRFTCSTALDVTPPQVVSVYPRSGMDAPKNSVIQINFSEPMDPTGIQGVFSSTTAHYEISNGHVFLKADKTTKPLGNFILTNGYRTLEFTSTKECETKNACGKTMYCLPVCDKLGTECNKKNILKAGKVQSIEVDDFAMILRSAVTLGKDSFEAKPFSGVMDLASNALDGNKDNKVNSAPTTTPVFPDFQKPDNFYWNFTIKNQIDLDSAYLTKVTPGPEATYVTENNEVSLSFTKPMRTDSLYDITLEEYPDSGIPVCYVPRAVVYTNSTLVNINHCLFLSDKRYYYIPTVPSEVEDVNYNCYYPGLGPSDDLDTSSQNKSSKVCNGIDNCCDVSTSTLGEGDLCCSGNATGPGYSYFTSSTCKAFLKT